MQAVEATQNCILDLVNDHKNTFFTSDALEIFVTDSRLSKRR